MLVFMTSMIYNHNCVYNDYKDTEKIGLPSIFTSHKRILSMNGDLL